MEKEANNPKFRLPKYDKQETIKRIKSIISKFSINGDIVLKNIDYRDKEFENIVFLAFSDFEK